MSASFTVPLTGYWFEHWSTWRIWGKTTARSVRSPHSSTGLLAFLCFYQYLSNQHINSSCVFYLCLWSGFVRIRENKNTRTNFSFSFLTWIFDKALKNSTPGKLDVIWQIERVQIDTIKLNGRKFIFLPTFSLCRRRYLSSPSATFDRIQCKGIFDKVLSSLCFSV